jgi:protein-disulfide isomerase
MAHAVVKEIQRRLGDDLLFASRIREDFKSGVKAGVNGTPTFFING